MDGQENGGFEQIYDVSAVKQMMLPELRRHLRSRGQTPAGGRQALQERLTEYLVQSGECDPVEQGRVAQEAPYVEPVFRPPPGCTPSRGQSNTNSAQVSYLFGGHGDAAGPDPSYFEPPPSPGAPFLPAPYRQDPNRIYASASAAMAVDAPANSEEIASVAFMPLPVLRESLRSRGLSPAGSKQTLQERLVASLKGTPTDCQAGFVPALQSGYGGLGEYVDPGSRPSTVNRSSVKVSQPSGGGSQLGYLFGPGATSK